MRQFGHSTPVVLRSRRYEHLHEVEECEEYAEGHHEGKQELLVAAHVPHVAQDGFQRILDIELLFFQFIF